MCKNCAFIVSLILELILCLSRKALKENGVIVVKENVTSSGDVEEDKEDASVTRSEDVLLSLLTGPAGLRLVREMKQPRFPKGLFPVRMYALRPRKEENVKEHRESETMITVENNN
jgi:protein N-terminal methyltransferase